jgi:hypothetical protein
MLLLFRSMGIDTVVITTYVLVCVDEEGDRDVHCFVLSCEQGVSGLEKY